MLEAMSPEEDAVGLGDLLKTAHHQLQHLVKISKKSVKECDNLLFACLYLSWIDIHCLEVGEEELYG